MSVKGYCVHYSGFLGVFGSEIVHKSFWKRVFSCVFSWEKSMVFGVGVSEGGWCRCGSVGFKVVCCWWFP